MANVVKVYTKNHCSYCDALKRLLAKIKVEYQEENLEKRPDERQRLSALAGGYRTMPMVWIGDEFIGGYTDVEALYLSGDLFNKIGV
jgi:glutaredoxin 3